jgi:hypothetical protein
LRQAGNPKIEFLDKRIFHGRPNFQIGTTSPVKLNPVRQTRNELKLGVVKFAQPITYNVLHASDGRDTEALNCKPITNL